MRADKWGGDFAPTPPGGFPFVRRVGPVALIGVNSAVETPPFVAAGDVGAGQLKALDALLPRLEAEGLIRVVLIHHPPLPGQAPPRRALRDAGALARVLAHRGAELVLHGHNHVDSHMDFARLPEAGGGSVPVIGIASGSGGRVHGREPLGRYNLLRIGRADGRVHIECVMRGIEAGAGRVGPIERKLIA
jgi:hypothetical protein